MESNQSSPFTEGGNFGRSRDARLSNMFKVLSAAEAIAAQSPAIAPEKPFVPALR